jgi:peptidoglycan hydrolase CwlO-like protein
MSGEDKDECATREDVKKFAPMLWSMILVLGGWALSVETRINNTQTTHTERGPKIAALEAKLDVLTAQVADPSPKAETRVEMVAMKTEHEALNSRIDRLETRINSLHQFILNIAPRLPIRRGALPPFSPNEDG